ncbi:adenylate kinase [Limnochorda pilosa]|uniref:Adenylate kinase n=1 Tax=Limnochorda pilosa TaxID=1555112 RepID=A0A0K2SGZ6_LIMPI|nr:adenylate kinase [Limnochorda pilosa]
MVDGNYSRVRDLLWPAADTVVWLDFSPPVIMGRLLRRTLARTLLRRELWSGNRESLGRVFSRDSILLWALRTYRRRRREYPELFHRPEHRHLRVIHLRSPREVEAWLHAVRSPS